MTNIALHVGDTGTELRNVVKDQDGNIVDLTSATAVYMVFTKPDLTVAQVTGFVSGGGSDGIVRYLTLAGTLDQEGTKDERERPGSERRGNHRAR